MKSAAALAFVVLFSVAVLFASVLKHPNYTPDGIVYARYALRDAGRSERDATLQARAFYRASPLYTMPKYRPLVDLDPSVAFERSRIFANRFLYPAIVSALLPAAGLRALFAVSALSYVAFGAAMFWLLLAFGRPWIAALLTIAALSSPLTRELAASDLTDMLCAVWWVLGLGALLRLLAGRRWTPLAILAAASLLLALTRPTVYLLLIPAAGVALLRRSWQPFAAALPGAAVFAADAALVHAYGVGEELRWVYEHEGGAARGTFAAWYRGELFLTIRYTAAELVRTGVGIVAFALALVGLTRRVRDAMIVLLLAAAATIAGVVFDPVPSAVNRVVFFPLIPVACAIVQCALTLVSRPLRKPAPAEPAPEMIRTSS